MNAAKVLEDLKRRFPNEPEYHQLYLHSTSFTC